MLNKIKNIVILVLSLIILFLYYILERQNYIIERYEFGSKYLPIKAKQKIQVTRNTVRVLYRDRDVVKEKIVYVPQEGKVTIIETQKDEKVTENKLIVDIKYKGFTLHPGINILYNKTFLLGFDLKTYYYKQYSFMLYGNKKGLGIGVSRHIDDIVFSNFSNIELMVGYTIFGENKFYIGLRSNF